MVVYLDPKNKEVILGTQTKASDSLYNKHKKLGIAKVVSAHSSQQVKADLQSTNYSNTIF